MDVFNKVRRMAGKYSAPSPPLLLSAGRTVSDPKTVADLFAEHFASVSRKDPAAPGARYCQSMEYVGVNFSSTGRESYNVPFSVSKLQTARPSVMILLLDPDKKHRLQYAHKALNI
ncbi:hypothetical protein E2C01_019608 [Portunus trituberculatus]|uniref:Uncharacterized protein n=1 Tax=Portunus trituberculatus TaxID=210409 RepID=A0A5B7DZB3_PORTR|nr:hypothetical protein [Portunus trituberculatus]